MGHPSSRYSHQDPRRASRATEAPRPQPFAPGQWRAWKGNRRWPLCPVVALSQFMASKLTLYNDTKFTSDTPEIYFRYSRCRSDCFVGSSAAAADPATKEVRTLANTGADSLVIGMV